MINEDPTFDEQSVSSLQSDCGICFSEISSNEFAKSKQIKPNIKKGDTKPTKISRRLRGVFRSSCLLEELKNNLLSDIQEEESVNRNYDYSPCSLSFTDFCFAEISTDLNNLSNISKSKHISADQANGILKKLNRLSRTSHGRCCIRYAYMNLEGTILLNKAEKMQFECHNPFQRFIYHQLSNLCLMSCSTLKQSSEICLDINKTSMTTVPPAKFFEIIA